MLELQRLTKQLFLNIRKTIITIICAFYGTMLVAQSLEILGGFFTYNMGDMKEIQLENQQLSEIDVFRVENFAPQPAIELQITIKQLFLNENLINLGLVGNVTATGGRLSYADFSGSYTIDQRLDRIVLGSFAEIIKNSGSVFYGANGSMMLSITKIDFESELNIDNLFMENISLSLNSKGINFRVLGLLGYNISSWGYLITKAGYQIDLFESKLTLEDDDNVHLLTPRGDEAKSKWSGIRLLMGIGFKF